MKELELKHPVTAHGETISVLEFNEPTGKDVRELGYLADGGQRSLWVKAMAFTKEQAHQRAGEHGANVYPRIPSVDAR